VGYAAAVPPELGNDEVRLPLYCTALGFPAADTGFVADWATVGTDPAFNVGGPAVDPATLLTALQDPAGPRVFHPVRTRVRGLRRRVRQLVHASAAQPS
jgi:hypothetical protein